MSRVDSVEVLAESIHSSGLIRALLKGKCPEVFEELVCCAEQCST